MVRQMFQNVPSLGRFSVSMAFVPVEMAMADCMVLECPIGQCAHYPEALLSRLFRLQLILFHSALFTLLLRPHFSHLYTELGHRCLCKTHHLYRSLSSHKHEVSHYCILVPQD